MEKLVPDPFLKNRNWAYLWIISLKFYTVYFYCIPTRWLSKYIETKLQTTCFYSYKAFLKSKTKSGTSLSVSFCARFLKKIISLVIFYWLTKFHCLVAFASWDFGHYMNCNCLLTRLWLHNFEVNLVFLIKPFFILDQNVKTKI